MYNTSFNIFCRPTLFLVFFLFEQNSIKEVNPLKNACLKTHLQRSSHLKTQKEIKCKVGIKSFLHKIHPWIYVWFYEFYETVKTTCEIIKNKSKQKRVLALN